MKKKNIVFIFLLLMIGSIISVTLSSFSNSTNILNVFQNSKFKTEVIENAVSSDNWLPGNTIDKMIYVENKGSTDVAVRASIKEEWVAKNGKKLSGFQNDNKATIINFSDNDDWIQIGDYYYYKHVLNTGDKTSNFIDSVTFNVEIQAESGCIREYGEGIIKTICTSSDSSYAGASYKLKVVVDTIQYDMYQSVWNIDLEIN